MGENVSPDVQGQDANRVPDGSSGRVRRKRKNNRMRRIIRRYCVLVAISTVVAVVSLIFGISAQVRLVRQRRQAVAAGLDNPSYSLEVADAMAEAAYDKGREDLQQDMIDSFGQGISTTSYLRRLFPDKVVYYDTNHYEFKDIDYTLPLHGLNTSLFALDESGVVTYSDFTIKTSRGIDVSRYQGVIDWGLVKEDGVEFAMIRSGYRSYGTGVIKEDDTFVQNVTGALQNGLHVGVYFFSQAVNVDEAVEEAQFVADQLSAFKVDYPVVIDVEEIANDTYRQQELTPTELTDVVIAFCDKISEFGYTPMIYANMKYFMSRLEVERLVPYEKWYAEYSAYPYYPYDIGMWQYSETGTVNGIDGKVDLNICFKSWS